MKRSAVPFAHGASGVIFLCLNPNLFANFLKSNELNGGPLSEVMDAGVPNNSSILSIAGSTAAADVEWVTVTSGYLDCKS